MADFSEQVFTSQLRRLTFNERLFSTKRVTLCLRNQNVRNREETQPWRKRYAHALGNRKSETILRNQNLINRHGNYVRKLS